MFRARAGLVSTALVAFACGESVPEGPSPLTEVDPFIGTGGLGFSVGSIPPGPTMPFGLAKPGPDTSTLGGKGPGFSHCAGYWWEDDEIRGFSQIHLAGTGVPDYGVLMLMPTVQLEDGPVVESRWRASFDHRNERASPGYYRVALAPSGIDVELSATERTSIYRFTYPADAQQNVVVSLAHGIDRGRTTDASLTVGEGNAELFGSLHHEGSLGRGQGGFSLFFVMRFDRTFSAQLTDAGTRMPGAQSLTSPNAGAVLAFDAAAAGPVRVQIGLSFVDVDTARANLDAEWAAFDLDAVRTRAEMSWEAVLSRVRVIGGSTADREKLYTALYHAYFMPTSLTEAGGRYRGIDGEVRVADGFTYYSDFSLWDTFRTLHPLLVLIDPQVQRDMNTSLVAMLDATRRVPKWPLATGESNTMIGYHGETVLMDSWLKGVGGFDAEAVYGALHAAAMGSEDSLRKKDCASSYLQLGWCAADRESGSVSKTLENAFGDFVLSRFAANLGHTDHAAELSARASAWSNLWDPAVSLLRDRNEDGSFPEGFDDAWFGESLVEGNARQWTTFVPHDVPALAERMGGAEPFVQWLDGFFRITAEVENTALPDLGYWHGNEPDIHAAYMFAEAGRPDLTAHWVDWIRSERYTAGPDGLDGNDDGGTLSAWFVFSALGLYPKVGEARYVLGTPLFPEVRITLAAGRELVIRAEGLGDSPQVERVTFDGSPIEGPFIDHARLAAGGELVFQMRSP